MKAFSDTIKFVPCQPPKLGTKVSDLNLSLMSRKAMEMPECNNVYGTLICAESLEGPAASIRQKLCLAPKDVNVKVSQFDGAQTLQLRTTNAEFDACRGIKAGEYLFNGAVAGTLEEICLFVQRLHSAPLEDGYRASFEIYDKQNNGIAKII